MRIFFKQEKLSDCEVLNTKIDLPYLRDNKHMKFNKDKYTVNPACEMCHLFNLTPKFADLTLYLHAMRYKIDNQEYFAFPPKWAQFSEEFDYANCKF